MLVALQVVVTVATLVSTGVALFALRAALALRQLADQPDALPEGVSSWPTLTLVIPACDEAATIAPALRSKLDDGYPALEVVVVDDRSTDGTGDVVSALAAEDARLKLVRVDELPAGWLGKVHALQRGLEASTGEWVLFSDADVRFAPGTMRRAMAFALRERRDLVAVAPSMDRTSWLLDTALAVFMRVLVQLAPPQMVADDDNIAALGSGSFNLVRRAAWDRTPGFPWMRMEAADDVMLGTMMKLCGLRIDVLGGKRAASVLFYPDLGSMFRGIEKNLAFDTPVQLLGFMGVLAVCACNEYASLAALALGLATSAWWLTALGAIGATAMTACTAAAMWVDDGRFGAALGWPIGYALLLYGLFRAALISYRRGGVQWRGTFYSTKELHAGARMLSREARRELLALRAEAS
jgi:hypothetical protein